MIKPLLIGLSIGIVIGLLIALKGCNHTAQVDTHVIDSVNSAHTATVQAYRDSIASYRRDKAANDSERNAQLDLKDAIEKKMATKITQLTFSLNKYHTATLGHDTAGQLSNCDDIVVQLDSLYAQALIYKLSVDSLTANSTTRRSIDSLALMQRDVTITQLQEQYAAVSKLLVDAIKDNADLRTALAKSKKGKWLIAGISALIGGLIVGAVK